MNSSDPLCFPKVIAHRGANQLAPENTLRSFELARKLGCSWVECDVLLTRDRVPVIFHDDTLERLTGQIGEIAAWDFAKLRTLTLLGADHCATFIPSLKEALDYFCRYRMNANIELKAVNPMSQTPYLCAFQDRKNAEISCHLMGLYQQEFSDFLISSFSIEMLVVARKILPKAHLALLTYWEDFEKEWPEKSGPIKEAIERLGCVALHANDAQLSESNIQTWLTLCPRLNLYTVNDRQRALKLWKMGVTTLFADNTRMLINDGAFSR